MHGHTHDSFDYRVGATRMLANRRSYVLEGVAENARFDPGLTVQVPRGQHAASAIGRTSERFVHKMNQKYCF
ncbi:hypothetical protein [Aromatoleum petrolei]|uniref:hypothetical protein n=1 Tax=Aromatoleum petrolei TaxID=76116 RepID=UPI001BB6512D|nr:hypothetical protein [Aromatoleum petrolei]QTQ39072.1 Uncharacterized protein ToN1_49790 [Aromatoleum petrolei]